MKKIKRLLLGLTTCSLLSFGMYSCTNEDVTTSEENGNNVKAREYTAEDVYKMNIDNGLDGDIMVFSSAEVYDEIEDRLYDDTQNYIQSVMETVPRDLSEEEQLTYLNNINFDEDKFYKDFENAYNFSSLRKYINREYDIWLSQQPQIIENDDDDPDNHPLVLEAQRTLFNSGGEIIVKNADASLIIYKIFDWGHLEIENLDTDILKVINSSKIKNYEQINELVSGNRNYKLKNDPNKSDMYGCAGGFVHKKYNYSSTNRQVKSYTKENAIPFSPYRQLVAKTRGYRWDKKKGYYRVSLWLVNGITGAKDRGNVDFPLMRFCGDTSLIWTHEPVISYNVKLIESRIKNNVINNEGIKVFDNKTYSYHGEGQFVFTKDFHPPHEIYVIQNQ